MPYSSRRTSTGSLRPGNTSSPLTFGPRRTPEESSASATTNTATIATTIRISQRTMTPRIPPQCVLGLVTCRPHRRPVATLLTNSFEALLLRSRHIHAACCYAATVGRRVGDPNDPKKALSSVSIRAQLIRRANEGRKRSGPHTTDQTGDDDEVHGDRESVQGFGGRPDAERAAARGDGQHPSSKGVRVRFSGSKRTVIDGPFAETKELVAGFWLWQVRSREEAIEWLKRCPNPHDEETEVEIRQVFEAEDFGAEFTPELRDQEERVRAQIEKVKGK